MVIETGFQLSQLCKGGAAFPRPHSPALDYDRRVLHTLFSSPHPLQLQLLLVTFPHWLLCRLHSDLRASSESLLSTLLHACCHSAASAPGFLTPCGSCMCPQSLWWTPTELCSWRTGWWRTGRTRPCEVRSNQENPFALELADCKYFSQDNIWVPKCQNGTAWKALGHWKSPEEVRALENLNCCWKCNFSTSVSKPCLELFCYSVLTEKVQVSCLSCQQAFILSSASACMCSWQPQGLHSGLLPAGNQTQHQHK